jgi:hypothetical protein
VIPPTFEVRFEVDVRAETPEQAACIAREMLLDPDSRVHCDVHPYEWVEAADDWVPTSKRGTLVYFGDHRKGAAAAPVRPSDSVAWTRIKFNGEED